MPLVLMASLLLGACASTGPAPVEDLNGGHRVVARESAPSARDATAGRSYQVQRGDTLYSIAFRHGLEPFEVGHDSITPVSPDYPSPNPFTGKIEKLTFELTHK